MRLVLNKYLLTLLVSSPVTLSYINTSDVLKSTNHRLQEICNCPSIYCDAIQLHYCPVSGQEEELIYFVALDT